MKKIGFIPARYASKRLPGKALKKIGSLPMFAHVYKRAEMSNLDEVYVLTDHEKIIKESEKFNIKAILTRPEHENGTSRCVEGLDKVDCNENDLFLNIQGDEPLVEPRLINKMIKGFNSDKHDILVSITKKSNNTKVLKIYGYISETSDLDKDRVEVRHLNSKFNKDRKYFYAIKKSFNSANSYISNLDVWKNQLLNYEDNDIKHFYSIKQLSNYIKLRHKFYFFKSFFMVLFPHRKIYRRIMPFFYSLFSEKRIYKLIGVNIYPYKT